MREIKKWLKAHTKEMMATFRDANVPLHKFDAQQKVKVNYVALCKERISTEVDAAQEVDRMVRKDKREEKEKERRPVVLSDF